MKKACVSINGAAVPTAGPGGAARGRSSSRQSRGASCFAGRLLTLFAALLLAACGIVPSWTLPPLQWLPPGPATLVSPESIIVFGKVNLEVKLDGGASLVGGGRLMAMEWGKWWAVPLDEYYYVILPKEEFVFTSLVYWYKTAGIFGAGRGMQIIECLGKVGFHVPPDASAVYVGTLVFEGDTGINAPVTLVVKDEYDQAVRRLRKRNPEFSGSIVKSLFRFQGRYGVTRHSPASDATMSCDSSPPPRVIILPLI